ncbi:MAG: aldo/keto reductase [Chthonomonadales bacterium]
MHPLNRREFVERAVVAASALAATGLSAAGQANPAKGHRVKLGKSGRTSSLIGIGTGTVGWNGQSNQTRLGHEEFNRIIRHAYDRGITFFDCADMYGSHTYLREALKSIPREKVIIQTKIIHRTADEARADLDRFRQELGTDYIDHVLMHVVTEADWNQRYRGVMDVLEEAKQKRIIRAHGCSCHTLEALETAAAEPWVDVDLARFNPWGRMMDNRRGEPEEKAPQYVTPVLQRMRKAGKAVIGMKILGEGRVVRGLPQDEKLAKARESIKFALASGVIDVMVIGFQSTQEIDEILEQTRLALAEIGSRHSA